MISPNWTLEFLSGQISRMSQTAIKLSWFYNRSLSQVINAFAGMGRAIQ
jgi:hypothetical protein